MAPSKLYGKMLLPPNDEDQFYHIVQNCGKIGLLSIFIGVWHLETESMRYMSHKIASCFLSKSFLQIIIDMIFFIA